MGEGVRQDLEKNATDAKGMGRQIEIKPPSSSRTSLRVWGILGQGLVFAPLHTPIEDNDIDKKHLE